MSARRITLIVLVFFTLGACVRCETGLKAPGTITIMSYNLQTLFDPVDQGGEYEDFSVAKGTWNIDLYRLRIAALASAIQAAAPGGPEVLVVQEVENRRVLGDLAEAAGGYPYLALSPAEESTLACGVASRLPFRAVRAHRYRPSGEGPSSVPRYLLECELEAGGQVLYVLAAHWKSKLGGAQATEPERRAAAVLAATVIQARLQVDPLAAIILAGDLNENPDEYVLAGSAYPTALMPASEGPGPWLSITFLAAEADADGPVLYCPWEDYGGYSYLYAGLRERIDHLLLSPGLVGDGLPRLVSFSAEPPEFLLGSMGKPLAWSSRLGTGYSDHLPIRVTLRLAP
jgi:endonuclease/exonuclease/phosphatase family metal-dependent hydrolase